MKKTLSQKIITPTLVVSSVVLAASTPLSTVNALTAGATGTASVTGSFTQLKQQLTSAIDSNLSKLTQSQTALNATFSLNPTSITSNASGPAGSLSYTVNKDSANGQITTPHGNASYNMSATGAAAHAEHSNGNGSDSSASANVNGEGIGAALALGHGLFTDILSIPKTLLTKLQSVNQKAIDKLTAIKTQVQAATQPDAVQTAVQQYNQNVQDFAVANVQANVTKALDSQAKVLDLLQNVANDLQTQISKVQDCIKTGSASASGSVSGNSASGSASASAPNCNEFNVDLNSGDAAASLQAKLDQIKANMQTIRSFVSSSINLVASLNANASGTVASFQGISSQLDIVANLSTQVQNDLINLSASVNKQ